MIYSLILWYLTSYKYLSISPSLWLVVIFYSALYNLKKKWHCSLVCYLFRSWESPISMFRRIYLTFEKARANIIVSCIRGLYPAYIICKIISTNQSIYCNAWSAEGYPYEGVLFRSGIKLVDIAFALCVSVQCFC